MATDGSIFTGQVRDLAAAFSEGTLGVLTSPAAEQAPLWAGPVINCALVSAAILLSLALAPSFFELFPLLLGSLTREKPAMDLDNNVRLGRERDRIAMLSAFIMALLASRFSLLGFSPLAKYGSGAETLAVVGIVATYLILRAILNAVLKPARKGVEYHAAADRLFMNILAVLAAVACVSVGICRLCGAGDAFTAKMIIYETLAAFLLNCARRVDLSMHYCNLFTGFLYLCALDFFPMALIVSASVFLK